MIESLIERYHYPVAFLLTTVGLFMTIDADNLLRRLVGLSIFQTSIFLFYIALGKVAGGPPPILAGDGHGGTEAIIYSNPLPHVLILTAIVVGVATLAVGLTLIVRIQQAYGASDDSALTRAEKERDRDGAAAR